MKENKRRLTKQFCAENDLLFLPRTEDEAKQIQKKLFDIGFRWKSGTADYVVTSSVLSYGFVLESCQMQTLEKPLAQYSGQQNHVVCTLEQFDPRYETPELTRDEQVSLLKKLDDLTRLFNEMSAKVDVIYNEVKPRTLDKPGNKLPGK